MTNQEFGPEGSYYEAREKERTREYERKTDGMYPIVITFLFLALGFWFHLWHPAWLLFLTIPIHYMKPRNSLERWLNPVSITLIYLILGFFFHAWHPAWMLFLLIPIGAVMRKNGGENAQEESETTDTQSVSKTESTQDAWDEQEPQEGPKQSEDL